MSLSEAIRLGTMMTAQAFRTLFTGDRACAWGAARRAGGATPERTVRSARSRWPWAFAVSVNCPSCGRSCLVCEVVAHLNDDHRWARENIGAWVAGIELADAPAENPRTRYRKDAPDLQLACNSAAPSGVSLGVKKPRDRTTTGQTATQ